MDGTLAWTADLNDTCQVLVSPEINNDGRVYLTANHRVYSQELDFLSVWDLFNGTSLDGSMLGSKPITGLALMDNGRSILINAGVAGLYAVDEDRTPLSSMSIAIFLLKDLHNGKYCVLVARRQSGCSGHCEFAPASRQRP